jgi:plasmid stabilization system protein ParE
MSYRISRMANNDIERICDHIAQDNPAAADRVDENCMKPLSCSPRFPEWATPART